MLRRRTRSNPKDPQMVQLTGDSVSESKFYSFFNVPMFVGGLTSKVLESDSARSPTSPLDFLVFSNLGNPFRSPTRSSNEGNEGHRKAWFKNKVGLGIIDSPDFEAEHSVVLRASDSKNMIFGIKTLSSSQNFVASPKSLPKDAVISPSYALNRASNNNGNSSADSFELESSVNARSFSFDSERSRSDFDHVSKGGSFLGYKGSVSENGSDPTIGKGSKTTWDSSDVKQKPVIESIGSGNLVIDNILPSEIELSEDYTCVRVHGPNPKVTHIFGDAILSCHENDSTNLGKNKEDGDDVVVIPQAADEIPRGPSYPPSDFLSFCYKCNKNLDGEDIYMYRGEKAFCSSNCRLQEILIDEEMEQTENDNNNNRKDFPKPSNNESSSGSIWFIST